MSWLGVLVLGLALTDLAHSVRPARWVPEWTGAVAAVAVALLAGLTSARDLVALLVVVLLVLAWGYSVTRGFGRGPAWLPLVLLLFALVLGIGTSGAAPEAGGLLGDWLDGVTLPVLEGLSADRFLLCAGLFALQLSSGNVIVRLVLKATGTLHPAADGSLPPTPLKGGRLLGPLERVFILGLGLAGQLTAASIVVAAKGLLRFPELSSPGERVRIHQLTEYFLVGSFVSWLVALGSLVLLS
jgi:hypothetical protein